MRNGILLITAILVSLVGTAQTFHVQEYESIGGMTVVDADAIIEADDGAILLSLTLGEAGDTDYTNRIIRLGYDGAILDQGQIEIKGGSHRGYQPFFRHPYMENTNVYVYVEHGTPTVYKAILFDNSMNITKEISTALPYSTDNNRQINYRDREAFVLDAENNIVVMKRIGESPNFLFVKIDMDGKILAEKEVSVDVEHDNLEITYYPLFVYNESPLQYAFSFQKQIGYQLPKLGLAILDSDFNVIETKENVVHTDGYEILREFNHEVARMDDSRYLTSTMHFSGAPFSNSVALRMIDKEDNIVREYKHVKSYDLYNGEPEISHKSLLTTKDGGVYWIYTMPDPEVYGVRNLYVAFFDSELNLIWDKMAMSDVNHLEVMASSVCDDGRILISAFDLHERIYTIVGELEMKPIGNDEHVAIRPCSFSPNPSDVEIRIMFSPDVNCEKVEIYSMDGRMHHQQNSNLGTIDVSGLNSGIYMMKMTLDNGDTYTDKVVVR